MGDKSGIHWTDATWNAATGCTEVSAGCDHCYAHTLALRLLHMGQARYANGFTYTEHPQVIGLPRKWREPRRIFVNSMSDMFHEQATKPFVWAMLDVMLEVDRHTYQILTKRPGKMASWVRQFCDERGLAVLPSHIWCGTSTENQAAADLRIPQLLRVPASIRFLSCEPLIGRLDLRAWLYHDILHPVIHWVIAGGESGLAHRPMNHYWARDIRHQCAVAEVPFFFKQSSGLKPGQGRELDGRLHEAFPVVPVGVHQEALL